MLVSSVQFSSSVMSDSYDPMDCSTPGSLSITNSQTCSNSCPLSWWCHPTISSSVVPFSSSLHSFPASRSFPMSQFIASGGQSIGASSSVLPMNIQDRLTSGLTGLISFMSKGLSKVLSLTSSETLILRCSAFLMVQLSHPHDYCKNHSFKYTDTFW